MSYSASYFGWYCSNDCIIPYQCKSLETIEDVQQMQQHIQNEHIEEGINDRNTY